MSERISSDKFIEAVLLCSDLTFYMRLLRCERRKKHTGGSEVMSGEVTTVVKTGVCDVVELVKSRVVMT